MSLTPEQARKTYDRIGGLQDRQGFYEDPATAVLLAYGAFDGAGAVVEIGSGTGRLAARLLTDHLPPTATYLGIDVSPVMVRLASDRLRQFGDRARVKLVEGGAHLPVANGRADRVVATYVFDLLEPEHGVALLEDAHRVLRHDGLLTVAGLTDGVTPPTRFVSRGWRAVWRRWPSLVGGCRPVDVAAWLAPGRWEIAHREAVCAWGICSDVVVASPSGKARTRKSSRKERDT
ncbi:MAG: class I SAM-dependent methyltransferase [Acidimicrobiia bacterium]